MSKAQTYQKAFEYKVIYAFVINDAQHRGMIKVGDTTVKTDKPIDQLVPNCKALNQAALHRIREYTRTAGVTFVLKHTELAVRVERDEADNQILKAFRDHDVHRVLINSGFPKKKISDTTGSEWFEADVEIVKAAIKAVKISAANLSGTDAVVKVPIILRPEQEEAIRKTIKQFKNGDKMLWNAKMRFGKTVAALEIVRRMQFEKTIIITHRPVVDSGWYEDFNNIFYEKDNTIYGSKSRGDTIHALEQRGKNFIYFTSIQDLRGSAEVRGKFDKNQEVFKTKWNCVIIDEAHEGTTTELGEAVKNALSKYHPKILELSGTPFNIMDRYDETSTYTWDYVMEQERKYTWNKTHFGDSNPYDELPELKIYTYDLGDLLDEPDFITFEDKAFNFTEFFRTWTSDYAADHAQMPETAKIGDFVHEGDVWSFLNLMTTADENNAYPFSTEAYRDLFRHSLWKVPGIKEARALKNLMMKHPVFGNGCFDIVNVAGDGDEETKYQDALEAVKKAIKSAGEHNYTITLSCGKLTTGVTVREWTAVFMLAGSANTGAANYLQTIFRVQSPCNLNGKIKETGYVFDFAPDRTLKMVAAASHITGKPGKDPDRTALGKFLNYCPVIAISGSEMKNYDTNRLLQQLKRVYAERVVRSGFDDTNLYNEELLKLSELDISKFDELKGIIGKSKAAPKANDITVNDQGLTNEEYEEQEKLEKKKKKKQPLSPEEKARLEELKKKKKVRDDAISILRGISIRMPLLIYGADVPIDEDVTIDKFADLIDNASWEEFMPKGVTKEKFQEFVKYYDAEIFLSAGRRIRQIAKRADELEPTKRVQEIASLFAYFKNPDKETVLTPWRVVNMHMSDTLGGWDFFDAQHQEVTDAPRFVDQGDVTGDVFGKKDTKILEINSKTGLYPLYVTYSVYRNKCAAFSEAELTDAKKTALWDEAVQENIFVICKTKMAKQITQRTLMGYREGKINAHYLDDLINTLMHKPKQFIDKITKESYWKKGNGVMKFDAIVGNPPYQDSVSVNNRHGAVYHYFYDVAGIICKRYSLISPARFLFNAGLTPKEWNQKMLNDPHIKVVRYEPDAIKIFPNTEIKGGVAIIYRDLNIEFGAIKTFVPNEQLRIIINRFNYDEEHNLSSIMYGGRSDLKFNDLFLRDYPHSVVDRLKAIQKEHPSVKKLGPNEEYELKSPSLEVLDYAFLDIPPEETGGYYQILGLVEGKRVYRWINKKYLIPRYPKHNNLDGYKIFLPKASGSGKFGEKLSRTVVGGPNTSATPTFISIGNFATMIEAQNAEKYIHTKFARALLSVLKVTQDIVPSKWAYVPLQNFTNQSDIDWEKPTNEIDRQLYIKYHFSVEEVNYIEENVQSME